MQCKRTTLPSPKEPRTKKLASFGTSQAGEHDRVVGQEFVELRDELVELTVSNKRALSINNRRNVLSDNSHKKRPVLRPNRASNSIAILSKDQNSRVDDLLARQMSSQGVDGGERDAVKEPLS